MAAERSRQHAAGRTLGTLGERPPGIFGGLPVSEVAIFIGLVGLVIGAIEGGGPALVVGAIVCGLGVVEFTAREHFSGFRSHTTLLAAIPAVLTEVLVATVVGTNTADRSLLLLPAIPVFALSFWFLRRSFQTARHARATRPPAA